MFPQALRPYVPSGPEAICSVIWEAFVKASGCISGTLALGIWRGFSPACGSQGLTFVSSATFPVDLSLVAFCMVVNCLPLVDLCLCVDLAALFAALAW
jgi:hypothetical protein